MLFGHAFAQILHTCGWTCLAVVGDTVIRSRGRNRDNLILFFAGREIYCNERSSVDCKFFMSIYNFFLSLCVAKHKHSYAKTSNV